MDKVISTSSKRIFDYVVLNWTTYIDCNFPNVLFLTTYKRCSLQFVWETVQNLNKRFNWLKTGFNCLSYVSRSLRQRHL